MKLSLHPASVGPIRKSGKFAVIVQIQRSGLPRNSILKHEVCDIAKM